MTRLTESEETIVQQLFANYYHPDCYPSCQRHPDLNALLRESLDLMEMGFNIPMPKTAQLPPQRLDLFTLTVGVALSLIAFALQPGGMFIGILGLAASLIYALSTLDSYPTRLLEYRQDEKRFAQEITEYKSKERAIRKDLVRQWCIDNIAHDNINRNAPEGASEKQFYLILNRYFPGKIHRHLAIDAEAIESTYQYTADFAYIDKHLGLYIDIEIDEPYVYKTKKPTHFLCCRKEYNRNDAFVSRGWLVIRFSEEQVMRYADSCCKFIAVEIARITGETGALKSFFDIPNLTAVKRWSRSEAEYMARSNYRDSYLSAL